MSDDKNPKKNPFTLPPLPPLPPLSPLRNPLKSPKVQLKELQKELAKVQSGELAVETKKQVRDIYNKEKGAQETYRQSLAEYKEQLSRTFSVELLDQVATLEFRRALIQDEALAERIRNDIGWLRLVTLIYGGVTDEGLATYILQYEEIASVLQLDDSIRMMYLSRLREKPWWQERFESDDIVYSLAVYLDNTCGKLSKIARTTTPYFKPQYILNDSPLTRIILDALIAEDLVESLNILLWREWQRSADPLMKAHALVALLVTDTGRAIDALQVAFTRSDLDSITNSVLSHLQMRQHTLADPIILLGSQKQPFETLESIYEGYNSPQWNDLVRLFARSYTEVMSFPFSFNNPLTERLDDSPYLDAEKWTQWLSGYGDDAKYNYTTMINTMGEKLSSARAIPSIHLAYNTQFDQYTSWYIDSIPPKLSNPIDIAGEVFTMSTRSESLVFGELFHVALLLFSGIRYEEYPGLSEELLASLLALDANSVETVLKELKSDLLGRPFPFMLKKITGKALKISDPVIRSRALWRIAQLDVRIYYEGSELVETAIEAASQIVPALQRSLAFERLIRCVSPSHTHRMQSEAEKSAYQIDDPINRARSLTRLALYHHDDQRLKMLEDAVAALTKIPDERDRVDTLIMIRPYVNEFAVLRQFIAEIIETLKDEWQVLRARDLLSLKLIKIHSEMDKGIAATPVVLHALITDLLNMRPSEEVRDDLWERLLDLNSRDNILLQMMRLVADNDVDGLPFTLKAHATLETLLQRGEIDVVYGLLPHLRSNDSALFPLLRTWVETKPDTEVWRHAGLMLAENGLLDEQTLQCLLEVLEYGIDVSRYRASLVLHSNNLGIGKHDRKYRASLLGYEILQRLAEAQNRFLRRRRPFLNAVMAWTWNNIAHDNVQALQTSVEKIMGKTHDSAAAYQILSHVDLLEDELFEPFFNLFLEENNTARKALLIAWCTLSGSGKKWGNKQFAVPSSLEDQINMILSTLPMEVQEVTRVIPNRAITVADVIAQFANDESKLDELIPLANQKLIECTMVMPLTPANNIHEQMFFNTEKFPGEIYRAAERIVAVPSHLKLLFGWLARELKQNFNDADFFYKRATLLAIAGAAAPLAPASVFQLINELGMESLIADAARYQLVFWGRTGAVHLMAYMRHTPPNFLDALDNILRDVGDVQQAAIKMVENLRYVDEALLPRLIGLLKDESASIAYAAAHILKVIGRNEKTSSENRTAILSALAEAVRSPLAARSVILLEIMGSTTYLRNLTVLEKVYYKAIMDIINII